MISASSYPSQPLSFAALRRTISASLIVATSFSFSADLTEGRGKSSYDESEVVFKADLGAVGSTSRSFFVVYKTLAIGAQEGRSILPISIHSSHAKSCCKARYFGNIFSLTLIVPSASHQHCLLSSKLSRGKPIRPNVRGSIGNQQPTDR